MYMATIGVKICVTCGKLKKPMTCFQRCYMLLKKEAYKINGKPDKKVFIIILFLKRKENSV